MYVLHLLHEPPTDVRIRRGKAYEAALKDAGITRQAVWHQQTPDGGTLAIVYIEDFRQNDLVD